MRKFCLISLILFFTYIGSTFAQNEDAEGCKDYPLFTRMPNFHLSSCEEKEFDAFDFKIENTTEEDGKKETVEGRWYYKYFYINDDATIPSALQLYRNFENACNQLKNGKIIAKVVERGNSYGFITFKIKSNNKEIWINFHASDGEYEMYIVEKESMKQGIQANEILDALNNDGYISLDIHFETAKSTIKEESKPIIEEIYAMLQQNADIKVSIEGHTDNVGNVTENKKLSESRAKAVMDLLIEKGIKKERLSSKGWGQENPIADNRTEEGRAKNRRVEIVKK